MTNGLYWKSYGKPVLPLSPNYCRSRNGCRYQGDGQKTPIPPRSFLSLLPHSDLDREVIDDARSSSAQRRPTPPCSRLHAPPGTPPPQNVAPTLPCSRPCVSPGAPPPCVAAAPPLHSAAPPRPALGHLRLSIALAQVPPRPSRVPPCSRSWFARSPSSDWTPAKDKWSRGGVLEKRR